MKNVFFIFVFLFFGAFCLPVVASSNDITVKFMIDGSASMKKQDIAKTTAAILAGEINNFTKEFVLVKNGQNILTRILVDTFFQKGNSIESKGIFDYRLGQFDSPDYSGLSDFSTAWFPEDETTLNMLINRNWPAEYNNMILVVLSNSQDGLTEIDMRDINNDAKKSNSKLIVIELPRPNTYEGLPLKKEISKRIANSIEKVKKEILAQQFKMEIKVVVAEKTLDATQLITLNAPVKINLSAQLDNQDKFYWLQGNKKIPQTNCTIQALNESEFAIEAAGFDLSGEKHSQIIRFKILPSLQASADFVCFPDNGRAPLKVAIINKSQHTTSFQWSWGDGTGDSREKSPIHIYQAPGKYTIELKTIGHNGKIASKKSIVIVKPAAPIASFQLANQNNYNSESVSFINNSKNADSFIWNFGDGSKTSQLRNPNHKFAKPGNYTVTLTASNSNGDQNKIQKTVKINTQVVADFTWLKESNNKVKFENQSQGAQSVKWDFGDGESSTEENPIHQYATDGYSKNYSVTLSIIGANGEKRSKSDKVSIYTPQKTVSPIKANFAITQLDDTDFPFYQFTNKSVGAQSVKWDFGDGNSSTERSPNHKYNVSEEKTFNVTLTIYNAGQQDKKVIPLKVVPVSSDSSFILVLFIILAVLMAGGILAFKLLHKGTIFSVSIKGKPNKKEVKIGEIVPLSAIGGNPNVDLQIIKCQDDNDGDEYQVRFRCLSDTEVIITQKISKITLNDRWCDPLSMENIKIESDMLVIENSEDKEDGEAL